MIQPSRISSEPVQVATEDVLEALSSDASRAILATCTAEPRPVKEICERTGLAPSTAYRHVNDLLDRGLLERARTGLNGNGSRYDLYGTRFENVELLVDGEGVTLTIDGKVLDPADR